MNLFVIFTRYQANQILLSLVTSFFMPNNPFNQKTNIPLNKLIFKLILHFLAFFVNIYKLELNLHC